MCCHRVRPSIVGCMMARNTKGGLYGGGGGCDEWMQSRGLPPLGCIRRQAKAVRISYPPMTCSALLTQSLQLIDGAQSLGLG